MGRGLHLFLLATVALLGAACVSAQDVQCADDSNCDRFPGGQCRSAPSGNAWCAYSDDSCPSGERWSDLDVGDGLSGQCVGEDSEVDAGIDAAVDAAQLVDAVATDGPTVDAGPRCPPISEWEVTTVDSDGDVGRYSDIVVAPSGLIYISYYDSTNDALKFATSQKGSGVWDPDFVEDSADDDNVGLSTSIVQDDDGGLHISYHDLTNDALRYAYRAAGGDWETLEVSDIGGSDTSMGFADDRIFIVFRDQQMGARGQLHRRETMVGGTFFVGGPIGGATDWRDPDLAVDATGRMYVSFFDDGTDDLRVGEGTGGFTFEFVDQDGIVGRQSAIVVDSTGGLHVSYTKSGEGVRYAYRDPNGDWDITPAASGVSALETSVAVDQEGGVHITYYRQGVSDLEYLYKAPMAATFVPDTIADFGTTGRQSSIVVDDDGDLHVSFRNDSGTQLDYAYLCRE